MASAISGPVLVLSAIQSLDEPAIQGAGPYRQEGPMLVGLLVNSAIGCGAPVVWTATASEGYEAAVFPASSSPFYKGEQVGVPADHDVVSCVQKTVGAKFRARIADDPQPGWPGDQQPFLDLYAQTH